jgi:hypothetical protein
MIRGLWVVAGVVRAVLTSATGCLPLSTEVALKAVFIAAGMAGIVGYQHATEGRAGRLSEADNLS